MVQETGDAITLESNSTDDRSSDEDFASDAASVDEQTAKEE